MSLWHIALPLALALHACGTGSVAARPQVHVAASSNLGRTLGELNRAFEAATGIAVVPSLGATAQLAAQIENGAPFDVFLSADTAHVDQLVKSGAARADSRAVYARGRLAVWTAARETPANPRQLTGARVIAIAKPELAPYGAAAVESLQHLGLWQAVQPRVVYAPSVSTAKQYADTGNADAAFTALSLVIAGPGHYFVIDSALHQPIEQALCVVQRSPQPELARTFAAFVLGEKGRAILRKAGYGDP